MKVRILFLLGAALFIGGGMVLWSSRGAVRDMVDAFERASLPDPVVFEVPMAATPTEPIGPTASSTGRPLSSVPVSTSTKPLAEERPIPRERNLAVPFLSQAPKQDWSYPYQEACEEAASLMVDAFYRGRTKPFDPLEGDRAILAFVEAEKQRLGFYEDTTAAQTADMMRSHLGYRDVRVVALTSPDQIKKEIVAGRPVIVPASGKDLKNPNFRNGGPPYHMLVIKGYTSDQRWITNDPGTRRGADYVYANEVLWKAIHDWNGGAVRSGAKVMIVVYPNVVYEPKPSADSAFP